MSIFEPTAKLGHMPDTQDEFHWVDADEEPVSIGRTPDSVRSSWLFILVGLMALSLFVRLSFLQVAQGRSHQLLAQGNRMRTREILPPRGVITDRFDVVLAKNIASFQLQIVPADLPSSKTEREATYQLAASLINGQIDVIRQSVEHEGLRSPHPVILQDHVNQETAIRYLVEIGNTPGVTVADLPQREYVHLPGIAHLLGYTGKVGESDFNNSGIYSYASMVGKTGIEQMYESQLYGKPGNEKIEVNSKGYFQRVLAEQPPLSGDTVQLTLDAALQQKLGDALAAKLAEVQATAGAAIALDPRDGSILAMVSLPDYDNNEFAAGISKDRLAALSSDPLAPLTNRAIAGTYPSGSVIKPVIASGGLAEGIITEHTTLDIPKEIKVGDFVFPDWKAHGMTDVRKALAVSSNIFFYAVGGGWDKVSGLGIDRLDKYLKLFGFGKPTGIDLPGEVAGLVPTPAWKEKVKHEPWYLGDTYHLSIGQGDFLVTPLQMAMAITPVINHGSMPTPHLLMKDETSDVGPAVQPAGSQATKIVDDAALEIVRQGMKQGVESGSSRKLQSLPVSSAGKTGTAQFGSEDKTHAWFTGYAPYDNPEIAITILIEGGGAGNEVAVPIADDVLNWYFREHHAQYSPPSS
jgi:penicillin-binding protein 2